MTGSSRRARASSARAASRYAIARAALLASIEASKANVRRCIDTSVTAWSALRLAGLRPGSPEVRRLLTRPELGRPPLLLRSLALGGLLSPLALRRGDLLGVAVCAHVLLLFLAGGVAGVSTLEEAPTRRKSQVPRCFPRDPAMMCSMGKDTGPWDTFRAELKKWMALRNVSDAGLSRHLESLPHNEIEAFSEDKVRQWRTSTQPTVNLLVPIARFLKMSDDPPDGEVEPTYLLRKMEILDEHATSDDAVALAFRLQKLHTKMAEATRLARSAGRAEGAAQVVRAGVGTGKFAVAVQPAIEGPAGDYSMHVADRIDIKRADGRATKREDVWGDRDLRTALRASGAIEVVQDLKGTARWNSDFQNEDVSHWSIVHVGAPTSAIVPVAHPELQALAVSSLSPSGSAEDIGSLVAMVLGYGFTSVRDLACEIYGRPLPTWQERNIVHEALLYRRTPQRRVWGVSSAALEVNWPEFPFTDRDGMVHPGVMHFRLLETDAVLENHAKRRSEDVAPLIAARDTTMETIRALHSDRIHTIAIDRPRDAPRTFRSANWRRGFVAVREILKHLDAAGLLPDLQTVHAQVARREPAIAPALLRWLADNGAPGVHVSWSSETTAPGRAATKRSNNGHR